MGIKIPRNEGREVGGIFKQLRQVKLYLFAGAPVYVINGEGRGAEGDDNCHDIHALAAVYRGCHERMPQGLADVDSYSLPDPLYPVQVVLVVVAEGGRVVLG